MGRALRDGELTLEERTLLEDPLANEALKRLGMTVDMLKPRSLSHFGSTGQAATAFQHHEKRRQHLWARVREEHARLQRIPSVTSSQVGGLSTAGGDTRLERMRHGQQASMRAMLERQACTVQREAEAEQRAERAALRQEMASANRDNQQLLRERELQHLKIKHGVRAEIHQETRDVTEQVRAEVCFGQRAGATHFTRMCLPNALLRQKRRTPRFAAGERVACAVEDATSEYSDWSAGTVLAVNCTVKEWEGFPEGDSTVPYQVGLDAGDIVLVHVRRLLPKTAPLRLAAIG